VPRPPQLRRKRRKISGLARQGVQVGLSRGQGFRHPPDPGVRVDHVYHDPHLRQAQLTLHYGDLTDGTGLRRVLEIVDPDEVYNLGAQSHLKISLDTLEYTAEVVAVGTLRLIEATRP
jgi:GDP-D-mannose dehydratase